MRSILGVRSLATALDLNARGPPETQSNPEFSSPYRIQSAGKPAHSKGLRPGEKTSRWRRKLVPKVAHAREDHSHAAFVGFGDDFFVSDGSSRLYCCGGSGVCGGG